MSPAGTTQNTDRVSRVRLPREPPLTPAGSAFAWGASPHLLSGRTQRGTQNASTGAHICRSCEARSGHHGQSVAVPTNHDEVVLRSGVRKWLGLLCGSGAFAAVGAVMVADGAVAGWLPLARFGCGALVAVAMIAFRPELRLGGGAFTTTQLWRRRRYELSDSRKFDTWTWTPPFGSGATVVVFDYSHPQRQG